MRVVIDGYNALFKLADLKRSEVEEFWAERRNLIRVLLKSRRFEKHQTFVVFDGKEERTKFEKKGGLTIIYTAQRQTADDFIFRLATKKEIAVADSSQPLKLPREERILVVTNDQDLRRRLKEAGHQIKFKKVEWLNLN